MSNNYYDIPRITTILNFRSIAPMLSTKSQLSRKRAMARKNAYIRYLTSPTNSMNNYAPEIDNFRSLIAIILELFLITIFYILQYVLIFILRRVERITANCGNRLRSRLCYHRRTFENGSSQSYSIGDFGVNKNDVGMIPCTRAKILGACLHDNFLGRNYDWMITSKIGIIRLKSRRFDKLRLLSTLRENFINCGERMGNAKGRKTRTTITIKTKDKY